MGIVIAGEDDPDDIVRCKHCGQSTDVCAREQNCYRYTGNQQGSALYSQSHNLPDSYKARSHENLQINLLSEKSFQFIAGSVSGQIVSFWPFKREIFSVKHLEHPEHVIDFLRITVEDMSLENTDIPEESVDDQDGSIPTVIEIEAQTEINPLILTPENSNQEIMPEIISSESNSESNPIFIHFEFDMRILKHTVLSPQVFTLLIILSFPLASGGTVVETHNRITDILSKVGAQLISTKIDQETMWFNHFSTGNYLLLVRDDETFEWYTAIIIMEQRHSLMFILNEQDSMETLVSTSLIFTNSLRQLIKNSFEWLNPDSETSDNNLQVFFYLLQFYSPLVTSQLISAAINEYIIMVSFDDIEERIKTSEPLSLEDRIEYWRQMNLRTVSFNTANLIPIIALNVQAQPVTPISHIEAIYTDVVETSHQQTLMTVNFIGRMLVDTLAGVLNRAVENGWLQLDIMKTLLANFAINLTLLLQLQLPDLRLPGSSFLLVIHSESQQKPPALLFVTNSSPNLTFWFVDLSTGQIDWKQYTTTSQKFREFLQNLKLLPVNVYHLEN